VFETYWTTIRGVEAMDYSYALIDMTVYGRQEAWEDSPPRVATKVEDHRRAAPVPHRRAPTRPVVADTSRTLRQSETPSHDDGLDAFARARVRQRASYQSSPRLRFAWALEGASGSAGRTVSTSGNLIMFLASSLA
jgi:hypothetical protein